jgi:uncharacterized protein YdaT
MPWDEDYYPRSMQHLPTPVRAKAIAIANVLLAEGHDEGSAIRIAEDSRHGSSRKKAA